MEDNNKSIASELKDDLKKQANDAIRNASKKMSLKAKIIFITIVLLVIGVGGYFAYDYLFINKGHDVTTEIEVTIKDFVNINELSTLEFDYNAIKSVYDENNPTKLICSVAYVGKVSAGVDFSKIDVNVIDKAIYVKVPKATILDANVDAGKLDYIFSKKKYDDEYFHIRALKECSEDLLTRANEETDLLEIAKDNAVDLIKALIEPLVDSLYPEYTVEVN